jgi:hypothetical protein
MSDTQRREWNDYVEGVMIDFTEMFIALGQRQQQDLRAYLHLSSWPDIQAVLTSDPETGEVALLLHGPRRGNDLEPCSES